MAFVGDRPGHVYSINPAVKFYMRNGKFYWAVKSRGFDSLEEAVSDADGFVMTDLSPEEVETMIGIHHSEGYGKVGYFKSKNFRESDSQL